ncbi:GMP synthase - Glutamine amidotransferase domain [Halalkaliarchaeum sp. AArc-CO]|uniref:type 1 glutamine amidotransferase n=1 Tax=unclassified Halalkaliarchaeum TaxID=2678344 RepID=UPI00217D4E91|nr:MULTISPECIES: type 1 glutamine amidotransferase [unclassified Halalkaliarchaeum]MDR5673117.1 type 1 glutamine amidotransferase [Halalkaliarchaeum sp. AArc-GB]UWG49581.1 GMP synthase - Glutamine amidotransferase domain [Halalkaliarchaeum sp. AArc-CO]
MKVALLNASPNPDRTFDNFRGILGELDSYRCSLSDYRIQERTFPDPGGYDAAIISGSADSVYDDEPYLDELRAWIRDVDLSCFGVCFGHQAIADAYGGRVEELSDGELGYRGAVHWGDPLFDGVPRQFVSFQSHGDGVVEPPDGADIVAANGVCLQAMRVGDHATVQFHPEIGLEYGRDLVDSVEADADDPETEPDFDAVRKTLTEANERQAKRVHAVFENYLDAIA